MCSIDIFLNLFYVPQRESRKKTFLSTNLERFSIAIHYNKYNHISEEIRVSSVVYITYTVSANTAPTYTVSANTAPTYTVSAKCQHTNIHCLCQHYTSSRENSLSTEYTRKSDGYGIVCYHTLLSFLNFTSIFLQVCETLNISINTPQYNEKNHNQCLIIK